MSLQKVAGIAHRLDLFLHVVDTVTGRGIPEKAVAFYKNGQAICPLSKGEGDFVFVNLGREDFWLSVSADGYIDKKLYVIYDDLKETLPILEICLLPGLHYCSHKPLHKLCGKKKGLVGLDGVRLSKSLCQFQNYCKEKDGKGVLNIYNPYRMALRQIHYALLDSNFQSYQPFVISKRLSDTSFLIEGEFAEDFSSYDPIVRLQFGHVNEEGDYHFIALDEDTDARFLLRFQTREENVFRIVDFRCVTRELLLP